MSDRQSAAPGDGSANEAPVLMVDAMLGKLARWLRRAGYDAEFWREGSDDDLIVAARAQGRLILTKDHALAGRRGVSALLIVSDDVDGQLEEARAALAARGSVPRPYTRCSECNGVLEVLAHSDAEPLVPPYVWQTQREFRRCTRCGRMYWKGTHWSALRVRLSTHAIVPDNEKDEGAA